MTYIPFMSASSGDSVRVLSVRSEGRASGPDRRTPFSQPCAQDRRSIDAPAARHRVDEVGPAMGPMLPCVLDQLDYGILMVGPAASVRFANSVARRECSGAGAVLLVDGQLRTRDNADAQRLQRALSAALDGRRSLLALGSADRPCMLAITPVDEQARSSSPEPTSLVVFGRSQACEPLSVAFYARSYALTAAETVVLRHLAHGRRPADVARETGVAISTVRTQILSIRLKTGARTTAELIRLLTMLPPIVPALPS